MLLRDSLKCVANVQGGRQLTELGELEFRPLRANLTGLGPNKGEEKNGCLTLLQTGWLHQG